jgi:soluble lytic murein transglycosylase-like protein
MAVLDYKALIVREARAHSLPPSLVAGLIDVESGGQPSVISPAGAVGLMQVLSQEVMPGRPTKEQLLDPELNVHTGCALLAELIGANGSQDAGLASYYGACYLGRPTDQGWSYIRLVEAAAQKYGDWDLTADDDFLEYAPQSQGWREAAVNLKGIATDALERGRDLAAKLSQLNQQLGTVSQQLSELAAAANEGAQRWGNI